MCREPGREQVERKPSRIERELRLIRAFEAGCVFTVAQAAEYSQTSHSGAYRLIRRIERVVPLVIMDDMWPPVWRRMER